MKDYAIDDIYEDVTGRYTQLHDKAELAKREMKLQALNPSYEELNRMLGEVDDEIAFYSSPETVENYVRSYQTTMLAGVGAAGVLGTVVFLAAQAFTGLFPTDTLIASLLGLFGLLGLVAIVVMVACESDMKKDIEDRLKDLEYTRKAIVRSKAKKASA